MGSPLIVFVAVKKDGAEHLTVDKLQQKALSAQRHLLTAIENIWSGAPIDDGIFDILIADRIWNFFAIVQLAPNKLLISNYWDLANPKVDIFIGKWTILEIPLIPYVNGSKRKQSKFVRNWRHFLSMTVNCRFSNILQRLTVSI